jgi:hypothetical protein
MMEEAKNLQWIGQAESQDTPETEHRLQYQKDGVKGQVFLRAVDRHSVYEPRYVTSAVSRSLVHVSWGVFCQIIALVTVGTNFSSFGYSLCVTFLLSNLLHACYLLFFSKSREQRVRQAFRILLTVIGFNAPISIFWK